MRHRVLFRLHNPKPGDWLPDPYGLAQSLFDLECVPRKGEQVILGGWTFDVVNVVHELHTTAKVQETVVLLKRH